MLPKGGAHLFPVSIFLDGKYYDARYYMAKPVPLALYGETVYEVLKDGMPIGQFTAQSMQTTDRLLWGIGDWKPAKTGSEEKKTEVASKSDDDDRPILKKPASSDSDGTILLGGNKPTPPSEQPSSSKSDDDDPDRPVLRKPKSETEAPQVQITGKDMEVKQPADDPDRPILSRNKPEQVKDTEPFKAPEPGIPGAKYYVAISDADHIENRPLQYMWADGEKQKWTDKLSSIAMDAVRKFAKGPGRTDVPANAQFSSTELQGYDLDYSNSPYMIFTGRIDPKPTGKLGAKLVTYYVTVVARVNASDDLNILKSVATDSALLDLNPRYELVDAVDADGDKRAELLFRKITGSGRSYVLYRMAPFEMTNVFEGGSGL